MPAFSFLKKMVRKDFAMDLGTANTLIYLQGEGVVLNEPTAICVNQDGEPVAVGAEAKEYLGRTPAGLRALRPMKDGVIDDFEAMTLLIRHFLKSAQQAKGVLPPRVIICVPSDCTQMEKKAVLDAAKEAGIKRVHLLEEVMAAAIGADLPIEEPTPRMVVDIGGGTTEVAAIAEMAYLANDATRVAGDELDEAIQQWLYHEHGLAIGPNQAERLKWDHGTAWSLPGDGIVFEVAGKDVESGQPRTVRIRPSDLRGAIMEPLEAISGVIVNFMGELDRTDVRKIEESGVTLVGGGALLRGIQRFLSESCGVPFRLVENPFYAVVDGAGRCLEEFERFQGIFVN